MQLKKLEMCGFKSFANRTEVVFDRGVTGIVGPNGCGKSNVVDAIKWVLGTLSYKSVRGEEMLDVIFKGAQGVAPMGFAEVSLTLDNSDHTLALEFEEVTITRRLFLTGEGEYYINRAPCRLKDIRELLYGTGIGTDNYSVIEQGKIDKLVLSNPHERRLVFDEAAGISKYRAKKRETENRLDKVSQDLLRIQDVVGEVQKQLRSVRAQAGRAARYKELSEQLKTKRLSFVLQEHRTLAARGAEIESRLEALAEERLALRTEVESRGREQGELQKLVEAETGRHAERASALAALESQTAYLSKSLEAAEGRGRQIEEESARVEADRQGFESRASEVESREADETRKVRELEGLTRSKAEEAAEAARRLEEATRECSRASADLEAKKAESMELAHKESQYRNERDRLQKDTADLERREDVVRAQGEKLSVELDGLRSRIGGARAERSGIELEIMALMDRKRAADGEQAALKAERSRLDEELTGLREAKEHRVARQETLRDLEAQLEGLETGARTLLTERPEGVLGTVADALEVSPEQVAAVEAALGDRAGAVVCETSVDAARAAALIRDRGLGRTVLVALDECRNGYFSDVELLAPGVLGNLSSFVKAPARFQGMVDALLGHALLVQDAGAAREVRREGLTDWPLVTSDGEVFDHPGVVTTGRGRTTQGLISRKSELRKLEDEVRESLERIAVCGERQSEVERRLCEKDEELVHLRQQIYEKNVTLNENATQVQQMSVREHFLSGERESQEGELIAIGRQGAAMADRAKALETLTAELSWLTAQVAGEVTSQVEIVARYTTAKAELQDALTAARIEAAKMDEQRTSARKHLEVLAAARAEVERSQARAARLLEEVAGRALALASEVQGYKEERAALEGRLAGSRAEATEAAKRREAIAAEVQASQQARSRAEAQLSPCEEEIQHLRVEEEGLRVKVESVSQRAKDELAIDLAAAASTATPEEGVDWAALGREIDEVRGKLSSFGAVNVVALDQLAELEEREKYMLTQQEDLVKSKTQMEELIRDLNRESRELFEKTFDFVREQFGQIFRKIFGGGKSDLVIEQAEGVDAMEQGLEIMARPPGKELTSISLLSGGERSLTAIALVMALFKANPSPFCLLDEADAALDEKNVERYAGVVREFAAETQFIVITHNKRSMAVCDALYGVTMEQPGVSKKVSVSLSGDGGLDLLKGKGAPAPA